jgi:hypothetical protein
MREKATEHEHGLENYFGLHSLHRDHNGCGVPGEVAALSCMGELAFFDFHRKEMSI